MHPPPETLGTAALTVCSRPISYTYPHLPPPGERIWLTQSFNVGTAGAKIFSGPAGEEFGYTVKQTTNHEGKWYSFKSWCHRYAQWESFSSRQSHVWRERAICDADCRLSPLSLAQFITYVVNISQQRFQNFKKAQQVTHMHGAASFKANKEQIFTQLSAFGGASISIKPDHQTRLDSRFWCLTCCSTIKLVSHFSVSVKILIPHKSCSTGINLYLRFAKQGVKQCSFPFVRGMWTPLYAITPLSLVCGVEPDTSVIFLIFRKSLHWHPVQLYHCGSE